MDSGFLISAFVTLFVIIDPVGMVPLFIALTPGATSKERRAIALRACVTGAGVLCLFLFLGEQVLGFIGISMPAFQIAGGILLFLTALEMLFERRSKRREDRVEEADPGFPDPSVFPLAIPLVAGPGAIASIILLSDQVTDLAGYGAILGVMLFVLLIVYLFFLSGTIIERALGKTGIVVVTRLLGMLLAALSVQFVLNGIAAFGLKG